MAKNWDTETAKTCRLPEFKSDACENCRDKRYCEVHKHGLVQMSIWDILEEKKSQEWQRVPRNALLVFQYGEKPMHLIHTVTEQALMDEPDEIREGSVNRIPAYIGFKEWRSGPDGIYVDYEAIQWKEKT